MVNLALFLLFEIMYLYIDQIIFPSQLMEIASIFGPLKAYRYEVNTDFSEPSAFLEVYLVLAIIVYILEAAVEQHSLYF